MLTASTSVSFIGGMLSRFLAANRGSLPFPCKGDYTVQKYLHKPT